MAEINYSTTKLCLFCAETVQAAAIVCRYCGRELPKADITFFTPDNTILPPVSPIGIGDTENTPNAQSEITYLKNSDVTVTSTRVLIASKTYALANVTSVTLATVPPDISGEFATGCTGLLVGLIAAGVGALMNSSGFEIFGVVVIVISIVWAIQVASAKRTKYFVRLGSSSGESDALWAYNKDYIQKIVNAINEAIIRRG